MKFNKIICLPDQRSESVLAGESVCKKYKFIMSGVQDIETIAADGDLIILLGGDGFLLKIAHLMLGRQVCIYGINYGTFGFLLNEKCDVSQLQGLINSSQASLLYPLKINLTNTSGVQKTLFAFNEASLLRETNQVAKMQISIDGQIRLPELVADGVVLSTPAGSTAYNYSVHGSIIPPHSNLLSLCPISPFRPRHWRGALISDTSTVEIKTLENGKRPVSVTADFQFEPSVEIIHATLDKTKPLHLLFNSSLPFHEKILREQFVV